MWGMESPLLQIEGLHAEVDGAPILRGVDLVVDTGEVHALMGPKGSGKSTLANVILGNPSYRLTGGTIRFKGEDITSWPADVRGKAGLFLAFQHPEAVPGLPVAQFLRQALSARRGMDLSVVELRASIMEWMTRLGMDPSFGDRFLNEGVSGGERKRNEILQMAILEPEIAILDETDSGLDTDSLALVMRGIHEIRRMRPHLAAVVVTHYHRVLEVLRPQKVHLLVDGRIADSGGPELADRIDKEGYDAWRP